jgi:hypothetical protein
VSPRVLLCLRDSDACRSLRLRHSELRYGAELRDSISIPKRVYLERTNVVRQFLDIACRNIHPNARTKERECMYSTSHAILRSAIHFPAMSTPIPAKLHQILSGVSHPKKHAQPPHRQGTLSSETLPLKQALSYHPFREPYFHSPYHNWSPAQTQSSETSAASLKLKRCESPPTANIAQHTFEWYSINVIRPPIHTLTRRRFSSFRSPALRRF